MATTSPVTEPLQPSPENPAQPLESAKNPAVPAVKSELRAKDSKETSNTIVSRPLVSFSSSVDVITVPSYSRWFSWNGIHESERRFLPEFFEATSPLKNPMVYKYYRDSIIRKFRENPSRKITFTEVRRTLVGDVGSIRRVFDFLEGWGLINYNGITASKAQSKWEEKENKSSGGLNGDFAGSPFDSSVPRRESLKKVCNGCKSLCSIACFACDKFDLTLCARCYVRGNYQVGVSSADFRRVEISEETKTEWTEKETLHLLEAIMHYGDDWKKVAEHVGGRSEKECVARFIKLRFGQQFVGPPDSGEDRYYETKDQNDAETGPDSIDKASPAKRRCLTPLADASNPIMAQASFLSAVVGSEVAEAAARAAVAALSDVDISRDQNGSRKSNGSLLDEAKQQESAATFDGSTSINALEGAVAEAQALLEKEEQNVEKSISGIIEVQMKEIQDKIVHFEEVELQMEKEWQQLRHMKNLLFVDQLTLLRQRNTPLKIGEGTEKVNFKPTNAVT